MKVSSKLFSYTVLTLFCGYLVFCFNIRVLYGLVADTEAQVV